MVSRQPERNLATKISHLPLAPSISTEEMGFSCAAQADLQPLPPIPSASASIVVGAVLEYDLQGSRLIFLKAQ